MANSSSQETGKTLKMRLIHKKAQILRGIRNAFEIFFLLLGAALVSAVALIFAKSADVALHINAWLMHTTPWLGWILAPGGMVLVAKITQRYAPYTAGSGIPQVMACISLPYNSDKTGMVKLGETLIKIPLTFLGMFCGASIGREGPSVQVGAALMVSWGRWCRKHDFAFQGTEENDMLAIGAAGGLAAAFNAPLAGVIFAIEELGRGSKLRWEGHIMIGVIASGLFLVSVEGDYPYFGRNFPMLNLNYMLLWVILCGLACGVGGGLFARFLSKGPAGFVPARFRGAVLRHPLWVAFCCGLLMAAIGSYYSSQTYGTGYSLITHALQGLPNEGRSTLAIGKWGATVASYWTGIPGGIFTPCLTTGGMIGEWIAVLVHVPIDVLVLLSMAAFLAAATQAPLTSAVITMEMTGSVSTFFWVLVCSILASLVSRQFCPQPFYHFAAGNFRKEILQKQEEKPLSQENGQTP